MKQGKRLTKAVALLVLVCLLTTLCGCTGNGQSDTTTTAGTTTVPTTTRTTGTPTTFYAAAEPTLEVSSPTGERPNAEAMERLASLCKAYKGQVSLYYKDLESGYTIMFAPDERYQAASVIKAPYVKYLLSTGVDLNEELTLQNKQGYSYVDQFPTGTKIKVGDLMEYAVRYSDNTAYQMLNKRFEFTGFNAYSDSVGATCNKKANLTLQMPKPRFGYLSARDVGLYFEDIAAYINKGDDNAKKLFAWMITTTDLQQLPEGYSGKTYDMENLRDPAALDAAYNARFEGYTIAHKYGRMDSTSAWSRAYHDGAIVWRDHPYVLAVTTNLDATKSDANEFYHDVASLVDQIHNAWYQY